jgi:hypothetical protein
LNRNKYVTCVAVHTVATPGVAGPITNDAATVTQVIYSASSVAERIVGLFLVAKKIYSVYINLAVRDLQDDVPYLHTCVVFRASDEIHFQKLQHRCSMHILHPTFIRHSFYKFIKAVLSMLSGVSIYCRTEVITA